MLNQSSEKLELTRTGYILLLGMVATTLALNVWTLMYFPPPFVDEAWYAGRAWSFIENRQAFGPLDEGVFDRFEGYWTFFPLLPVLLQSMALAPFAEPALLPLRTVSLVFGFLLLLAVFALAKQLYGKRAGLIALVLVSLSWPYLYSSHLARYDIMAAAFGFIAITLCVSNRKARISIGMISGLCVGLAFETHAHGAIYGPTVVALYFIDFRWSMFRKGHFWSFASGIGLGLVLYTLLHITPYPRTYFALNQLVFTATHTPPIVTLDHRIILQALVDTAMFLATIYNLLIPVIVVAVFVLAKRGSPPDKMLLIMNTTLIGGVALLIRNKFPYYAILFAPGVDLVIVTFLAGVSKRRWQGSFRERSSVVLIWSYCVGAVILNTWLRLEPDSLDAYQAAQNAIGRTVRTSDSIMGSQTYWFGLHDHDYYSWEQLVYYQRYAPNSSLEDALREFQPDVLIIDRHLDEYINEVAGATPYSQHLRLPRAELDAFLSRQAILLSVFNVDHYGPIRVYRLVWTNQESEG